MFIFAIGTDLADGYIARKLNSTSKLGAYLDATIDFFFISGMYIAFIINGIYSPWILLIIASIFSQFIILNVYVKKTIYDPIGKYYGSLLFGGIGLTLLFPDQLVYNIVTFGIVISTLASIISRLTYFFSYKKEKNSFILIQDNLPRISVGNDNTNQTLLRNCLYSDWILLQSIENLEVHTFKKLDAHT